jgi:hypothetical protein
MSAQACARPQSVVTLRLAEGSFRQGAPKRIGSTEAITVQWVPAWSLGSAGFWTSFPLRFLLLLSAAARSSAQVSVRPNDSGSWCSSS